MLQSIRDKAGSLVVKILFMLLIASFAVWGIGDIFHNRGGETVVAHVGDLKVSANELQVAVRNEMTRLRATLGTSIDMEQAKQFGLIDTTLNRIVARDLVQLEAERLKLAIGDDAVRRAIQTNPGFHNSSGTFDRTVYNRVLANNRLTEVQYEQQLRRDLVRENLIDSVATGVEAPATLVDPLYRLRNEKRVADVVLLPLEAAGDVGEPSEQEISDYYAQNQERFRAPEYRGFTALVLTVDLVAKGIEVPEQRLRDEYKSRLNEFVTPERRQIEQILVQDEAKAKEAEAQLAAGKDFLEVAKSVAGEDAEAVKLGLVKRDEMPTELADAAFSAEVGKPTAPVKSAFGWHIMRITEIQPSHTESFEEAAPKLKETITRDMAADQLFKLSNDVEDALAGGSTLEEVSKKFAIPPTVIAEADPDGKTPSGDKVSFPAAGEEILRTAFETSQGQVSRLTEAHDSSAFYVLRVDKVVPSAIRPLDQVRDEIRGLWKTEKQTAAVAAKAKEIADIVNGGRALAEVAGERGLKPQTTQPFLRSGAGTGLPGALVGELFAAKPNAAVVSPGPGGSYVAQLKSVDAPDPAADPKAVSQLAQQIAANLRDDVATQFEHALRNRYGVKIDQEEVARLF